MRLLFLSPIGALGGAEMCLLDLLASLRSGRPDWDLSVLLGGDGPLQAAVAGLGVRCDVLPLPPRLAALGDSGLSDGGLPALASRITGSALGAAGYLRTLKSRLRDLKPDLVQTNGMKSHLLGAWAAPRDLPVVWHMHDYVGSRALMRRLLRWSRRPGVRGVAVSRSVAEDSAETLGPRFPVRTVYNAVDLDRFAPGPSEGARLDRLAGLQEAPAGAVRIGLVATYARWKGHEVFLDAVARMPAETTTRFYVVGGAIYQSAGSQYSDGELKSKAESLGVANRVAFLGHQADPAAVYRGLDVVVHASTRPEPFGRVIAEAMACGKAVVVARAGGAAELFEDGVSALGCPPGDPSALASALERLASDAPLRRALGDAGRAHAVERFDRSRLAVEWSRVYADAGVVSRGLVPASS